MTVTISTNRHNIGNIGKHKIPRYIYHMTNKANYESIVKEGLIKSSPREFSGYSIFAIELPNCFKRWKEDIFNFNRSLIQGLINHSSKGDDDIVIIRIPTSKLDPNKLFIRSQNRFAKFVDNPIIKVGILEARMIAKETSSAPIGSKDYIDACRIALKGWLDYNTVSDAEHCIFGAPASEASRYKQRKEAIEYIYHDDIPAENIEKIGEVNINNLKDSLEYDSKKPIKSFFMAMLEGTPEFNCTKLLDC